MTMKHQVIKWPEKHIIKWVSSDLPAKGRHATQLSSPTGGGIDSIRRREVPSTQYMGEVHTQDDHSCCSSLTPQQTPGLHVEFLHTNCLRRKNIKPGWQVVLHDILISHKIALLMLYIFHLRWSWRTMGMGTPPGGKKPHSHCCVISGKWFLPWRVGRSADYGGRQGGVCCCCCSPPLAPRTFAQEKELIQQASTGRIVKCSNLSGVNFKLLVS